MITDMQSAFNKTNNVRVRKLYAFWPRFFEDEWFWLENIVITQQRQILYFPDWGALENTPICYTWVTTDIRPIKHCK